MSTQPRPTSFESGSGRVPTMRMPAFSVGTQAHSHSIHSAMATLSTMGIGMHRITVQRTGREGVESGSVVGQSPAAGAILMPDTPIRLLVAGLGFTHALPVGMWESGGETHAGTRELLEGFDDPLEKLKHWFHEGAPLFRISPDDPAACARWLALFGVNPVHWPRPLWYRLATLIAGMARFSCSHEGCAFVLDTLLDLPVRQFRYLPCQSAVPPGLLSSLGRQSSRLGVDLLMGDSVEDLAALEVEIGPVPLDVYERYAETAEGRQLLQRTMEMVMPVSSETRVKWTVLDSSRAPRLGVAEGNSRLGINTHMGRELG